MLDIALIGTGGFMPLPGRFLTAMAARLGGRLLLIDCGEGTQVTLRQLGWGFKNLETICLTHFHADHIAGLPGLLLTVGNSGRTEPLTIIGPKYTADVVRCLCVVAPLPFELQFLELPAEEGLVSFEAGGFRFAALPLDHRGDCFGYSIRVDRAGRFDAGKAKRLGIPLPFWSRLQGGETAAHEGKLYTPDMVMGPPRKGLKVSYVTDTRPIGAIPDFIRGSDLFICEGIYGEDEKLGKAMEHKHMIFSEAASLAHAGGVKELWLTHFSPALTDPERYLDAARSVFDNTKVGFDRMTESFLFEGD